MNAVNAMLRDQQEAELERAVEAADQWLDLARPIIMAMFKLEDIESEITGFGCDYEAHRARTLRWAACEIGKARSELDAMLDGIRDDFIADQRRSWTSGLSEEEGEAIDAFNDALDDETLSLADAHKRILAEWNDAWRKAA